MMGGRRLYKCFCALFVAAVFTFVLGLPRTKSNVSNENLVVPFSWPGLLLVFSLRVFLYKVKCREAH